MSSPRRPGPGLIAMGSPRFFGFVIGGTYPAAMAADWLVSAWDQNTGLTSAHPGDGRGRRGRGGLAARAARPACGQRRRVRHRGDERQSRRALIVARDAVLRDRGHDRIARHPERRRDPLPRRATPSTPPWCSPGASPGSERPVTVGADDAGPDRRRRPRPPRWPSTTGPTIVALQAGDVHSGAFDDFSAAIDVAHLHGAWVHVDGAFGLWAAASPRSRHLVRGRRARRLLGDRRPQDPQRAVRLRGRHRPRRSGDDGLARRRTRRTCRPSRASPTPTITFPSCRAARAGCRCGRRCGRWARSGVADLVDGLVGRRHRPRRGLPRASPVSRCSTTSSSRRCASPRATTPTRSRWGSGCATRGPCGRRRPPGAGAPWSASRSATAAPTRRRSAAPSTPSHAARRLSASGPYGTAVS